MVKNEYFYRKCKDFKDIYWFGQIFTDYRILGLNFTDYWLFFVLWVVLQTVRTRMYVRIHTHVHAAKWTHTHTCMHEHVYIYTFTSWYENH